MSRPNNATPAEAVAATPGRDLSAYVTLAVIAMGLCVAAIGANRTPIRDADDPLRSQWLMKINVNTASAAELSVLPGIGDALAARIVAFRDKRQDDDPDKLFFGRAEDLRSVHGIGPKSIEKIRPFLRFHQ